MPGKWTPGVSYLDRADTVPGRDEQAANARLIAAAPQLAEALAEALHNLERCDAYPYAEDQLVDPEVVQAARAALQAAGWEEDGDE